jgi:peptide chain release factor 3
MAADSAVMVLDGAKGVEDQTINLFHCLQLKRNPIFTFVTRW